MSFNKLVSKKLSVFVLLFSAILLFGCFDLLKSGTGGAGNEFQLNSSAPLELSMAPGQSAVVKIDNALLNVKLSNLTQSEALYQLSKPDGTGVEEVTVLTDGNFTNVDLDGDGTPNVQLALIEVRDASSKLRMIKIAVLAGALVPKMCTEGFERQSSADVVFLIDTSRSMDYPIKQESMDGVPADLREQMTIVQQKLPQLATQATDEELGEFLGTGDCYNVPRESRDLCNEIEDAYGASRSILLDSGALYNQYSKMSEAKRTASAVLSAVRSAQRLSKADVKVALVSFSDYATVKRSLTTDFSRVQESINELKTSPATNIGDALRKSFNEIEDETVDEKIFVLLTDGRPSSGLSSSQIIAEFTPTAEEQGTTIYTIGTGVIEQEIDQDLLETLATRTGGSYTFAATAVELANAFESALGVGRLRC